MLLRHPSVEVLAQVFINTFACVASTHKEAVDMLNYGFYICNLQTSSAVAVLKCETLTFLMLYSCE